MSEKYSVSLVFIYNRSHKDFKAFDFKNQVVNFYNQAGCFLCNQRHPAHFFIFVDRKYIENGESKSISVVRLFCEINYKERKETGKKLQYTITVLPSFLIPYSRVLFDKVIEAVDDHLVNGKTQSESLDKMGCINILTFRLHFSRVIKLLPEWIALLSRWIIDLGDSIKNRTLSETFPAGKGIKKNCLRWNQFKELLELFVFSYNRIPKTCIILKPFYFQFAHARFVLNGMPLGP